MKKWGINILVVITLMFASFTVGLLLGKNGHDDIVTVSVSPGMLTEPTQAPTVQMSTEQTSTAPAVVFPIDLNRATQEELTALPGIGDVLAARIVAYREENGPFSAAEELILVEGMGEKRVEKIIDMVTVGG